MEIQLLAATWSTMTSSRHQPATTAGSFNWSSGAGRSPYPRVHRQLRWWPDVANGASPGICPAVLQQPDSRQTWIGQLDRAHDLRFAPPATPRCIMMRGVPVERAS